MNKDKSNNRITKTARNLGLIGLVLGPVGIIMTLALVNLFSFMDMSNPFKRTGIFWLPLLALSLFTVISNFLFSRPDLKRSTKKILVTIWIIFVVVTILVFALLVAIKRN